MNPLRSSLQALRAALEAASRAVDAIEGAMGEHDDELLELAAGAYGRTGATLTRWAREGRLRAFEVERNLLVAWRSDVRAAIEARPALQAVPPRAPPNVLSRPRDGNGTGMGRETEHADPLELALSRGELRAVGHGRDNDDATGAA